MTDQPEALRLADRLDLWGDQNDLLEAAAELRRQHDEITALKAERDALKAAAEKGTEYVLAHINQDLRAERDALQATLDDYMDDHKAVVNEQCAGDEVHCSCVPHLRKRIKEVEAERDALLAEVERLKSVNYDLAGQLMVLRATKQMQAAIDAARSEK